jgi:hypothetical protein
LQITRSSTQVTLSKPSMGRKRTRRLTFPKRGSPPVWSSGR